MENFYAESLDDEDSGLEGPMEFFLMIFKSFCAYIILPIVLSVVLMLAEVPFMKELIQPLEGLWALFVEFMGWFTSSVILIASIHLSKGKINGFLNFLRVASSSTQDKK